jgi:hypothetical protein
LGEYIEIGEDNVVTVVRARQGRLDRIDERHRDEDTEEMKRNDWRKRMTHLSYAIIAVVGAELLIRVIAWLSSIVHIGVTNG